MKKSIIQEKDGIITIIKEEPIEGESISPKVEITKDCITFQANRIGIFKV